MNLVKNKVQTPVLVLGGRGQLCWNVSQFFPNITKVVAGSKAVSGIKGVMRPACGEVMARHKAESAKRNSMISTFISQIPCVTVHMLHGKS